MHRRDWLLRTGLATLATAHWLNPGRLKAQEAAYRSPYKLAYRHPIASLEIDFDRAPWNNLHEEAEFPSHEWYGPAMKRKYGAWGPPARQYPAPSGLQHRDLTWLQDRVILTASRWIGYAYQHHHIPDWAPPEGWPWIKVAYGRNSKGIDCSNFSSFYYNYALGIKLDTGIKQQGERRELRGPGGRGVFNVEVIERQPYDELVKTLHPADLLYIKNNAGNVAHVIMWLGDVGVSPDGMPLVLDSTGAGHTDSDGKPIPIGVHIRPFGPKSWYAHDFSHAHRLFRGVAHVRPGQAAEAEEGGADIP